MTDSEKQEMLTAMTGEADTTVLTTYLSLAEGIVLQRAFPYGDGTEEMPSKYDRTQVEIAAYLILKRGAEGETAHSENGVVRQYSSSDVPQALLRRIIPKGEVL